jgi:hypothetical protein
MAWPFSTAARRPGNRRSRSRPRLLVLDETLATELGLDPAWLRSAEGQALLIGTDVPDGATRALATDRAAGLRTFP